MTNQKSALTKNTSQALFKIQQAVIGLEASDADKSTLRYFKFFAKEIPVTSAFFIHAEPFFHKFEDIKSVSFYEDKMGLFKKGIEKIIQTNLEKYFSEEEQFKIQAEVEHGQPLQVLLNAAEDFTADLVVIGQKKGKKHHGILAKNFARKASGNALIVPERSKCKINTILVPVDFSENSARALHAAIGIQKQLKNIPRLIALNVFRLPNFNTYRIIKSSKKFKQHIETQVEAQFKRFLEERFPDAIDQIEMRLLLKETPNMGGYIYSFAADHNVDFMVIGAKGHSKLELLLMGSVTEKILSLNQSFPTLVVK